MVIRVASKGKQKGIQFYGCPNFPKCRQVLPIHPRREAG
jgi:ssDNA-binding Zn-finger/Zn-ribbon topoisomerase 1